MSGTFTRCPHGLKPLRPGPCFPLGVLASSQHLSDAHAVAHLLPLNLMATLPICSARICGVDPEPSAGVFLWHCPPTSPALALPQRPGHWASPGTLPQFDSVHRPAGQCSTPMRRHLRLLSHPRPFRPGLPAAASTERSERKEQPSVKTADGHSGWEASGGLINDHAWGCSFSRWIERRFFLNR